MSIGNGRYPPSVAEYIAEMLKRNTINFDNLTDKTFLNYLSTMKYDEAYVKHERHTSDKMEEPERD
jgi:putative lipase involved disintegration of autophagic bodies